MALIPPTITEYESFTRETYPTGSDERKWAEEALRQATDAFVVMTGIVEYPTDETEARVIRYGIMELAGWLSSQAEHKDEINSPFSSERIGSYSYSKMLQRGQAGEETGLWWLDKALGLYRGVSETTRSWSASENVMVPTWETYEQLAEKEAQVPTSYDIYGR